MVPWQMHNILTQNVGEDRLTRNMGGDRRTQNTLYSEFNLISKRLDTGPQTLRWSAGRFQMIIMPLCGPTCKLRLASWISTSVEFQVGPSLAKNGLQKHLVKNNCVQKKP